MTSLQDESASFQIINSTEFFGLARFIFPLMAPSKSFLGILPSLFNIKQTNKHTSSSHGFSSTLYAAPLNGDWGSQAPPGCERRTSAKPCAVFGRKDQAQPRRARSAVRKSKALSKQSDKKSLKLWTIRRQRLYEALLCYNQKWNYKFFTTSAAVQTQAP